MENFLEFPYLKDALNKKWPYRDLSCALCNHHIETLEYPIIHWPYTITATSLSVWFLKAKDHGN